MVGYLTARVIVAVAAAIITAAIVGLYKVVERLILSVRKPRESRKPAFSHAE
jgi:hypothetical protein